MKKNKEDVKLNEHKYSTMKNNLVSIVLIELNK